MLQCFFQNNSHRIWSLFACILKYLPSTILLWDIYTLFGCLNVLQIQFSWEWKLIRLLQCFTTDSLSEWLKILVQLEHFNYKGSLLLNKETCSQRRLYWETSQLWLTNKVYSYHFKYVAEVVLFHHFWDLSSVSFQSKV